MKNLKLIPVAAALIALPTLGLAQEAEAAPGFDEIGPYIMTTLLFLMAGFLVFFMAAGFAMLEGGLVRSKNVAMQMTKNIALYSVAAIMYWLIGFNLMYPGDSWIMAGWVGPFFSQTVLDPVGIAAADAALDYASIGSDFFFQLVFVAATASIVSCIRSRVPGSGAAAGCPKWASPTSPVRPSCTPWVAGPLLPVPSFWVRVSANTLPTAK